MSKPYKTCPTCGSNLDHGETCNCQREPKALDQPVKAATQEIAQETLRKPDEPMFMYGA